MHSQNKYLPKVFKHPASTYPPITVNSIAEEEQWTVLGFEPVKVAAWHDYPKMLTHPDYTPAKMVSAERRGAPVSADCPWAASARLSSYAPAVWDPERNPPVTVNNAAEEEQFVAKGYVAAGTPDKAAFSHTIAGNPGPREVIEYPKYVTAPRGEAILVKSAAEEDFQRQQMGLPARENKKKRAEVTTA
jgi:hypothetical protein